MNKRLLDIAMLLSLGICLAHAAPPLITSISSADSNVMLTWDISTNRFIVEQSSSLIDWTNSSLCVASSTDAITNAIDVSKGDEQYAFFRLQFGIKAVHYFPDTNLEAVVIDAIPAKHSPTNKIYDTEDLSGITHLWANGKTITNMTGIGELTGLTYLNCYNNQLADLDVSENTALVGLYCYDNEITDLNASACTSLKYLDAYNNHLTNLIIPSSTVLSSVYCYNNQLTSLDVSEHPNLTVLRCYDNQLTNINVSGCTSMWNLLCYNNQLTSLDVTENTSLTSLYCNSNQLTSLDVTHNSALRGFGCSDNQLTQLNLSSNDALKYVYCDNNNLGSLTISTNAPVITLYCSNNALTNAYFISGLTNLMLLHLETNSITDLAPLIENASRGGLGLGDTVYLAGNPLADFAQTNQIPVLTNDYNVTVYWP